MWGFPSPRGVTPKETDDLLSMNPEGVEVDVSQSGCINDYIR